MVMRKLWARFLTASIALVVLWPALDVRAENSWSFSGPETPLPAGSNASAGEVAFGPDGEIYYVFSSSEFGPTDVLFMRSTDFGVTWSTSLKVDTDPPGRNTSNMPCVLADPEGHVYVFFLDSRGAIPFRALRANGSFDRGVTWLADDILVYGGTVCGTIPRFDVGEPGKVYAVCGDGIFRSLDSGLTGSPEMQFLPRGSESEVSADRAGNVYVVWEVLVNPDPPFESEIHFNVSHDGGNTWKSETRVFASVEDQIINPLVTSDEAGHVYVQWYDMAPDDLYHYFVSVSDDFGESFGPPVQMDQESRLIGPPDLEANCLGNVYFRWPANPARLNVSHDFGATWLSEPFDLYSAGHYSREVSLAANSNGHIFAAYSVDRPYTQIGMNLSLDGGRTFLDPDLQVSGGSSYDPNIACDGQGHVAIRHNSFGTALQTFLRVGHAEMGIRLASGVTYETFVVVPPEGARVPMTALVRDQAPSPFVGIPAVLELLDGDGSLIGTVASKTFSLQPGRLRSRTITRRVPGSMAPGLYRFRLDVGSPIDDGASFCLLKE
jgi:hypothetical protein